MDQAIDAILTLRFGKDSLIALATSEGNMPYVRTVDAVYQCGAFYCITHQLSGKMRQIAINPVVAVCGEWFSGHGIGESLGHVLAPQNLRIAQMLKEAFAAWYDNGHIDEEDPDTIILKIQLTDGVVFSEGSRYAF